jgi:aminoglycoside phosphotransferase family enzyme
MSHTGLELLARALERSGVSGGRWRTIETHLSWVLLTGRHAYKVKKPVRFEFVDFSTLDARGAACRKELELGRRVSPQIYERVVAVTAGDDGPAIGGTGNVVEWAIEMVEFSQDQLLDRRLARGELSPADVDTLAGEVAHMHGAAAVAAAGALHADPVRIHETVRDHFREMWPLLPDGADRARLDGLRAWCEEEFRRRRGVLDVRAMSGRVRECHGDLHLGNIAWIDGRPAIFDPIEFNESFRWIDVASDAAFLAMDFEDRGHAALAWRFLNRWLARLDDATAPAVLPYYMVHRALVRAKVALLRSTQLGEGSTDAERRTLIDSCRRYLRLAHRIADPGWPVLVIAHGGAASERSRVALELACRLHGFLVSAGGPFDVDLVRRSERGLEVRRPTVVECGELRREERDLLLDLARQHRTPITMLNIEGPRSARAGTTLANLRAWTRQLHPLRSPNASSSKPCAGASGCSARSSRAHRSRRSSRTPRVCFWR